MSGDAIVPIIMGSKSDLSHAQAIAAALREFGIECALHIGSAHKTPRHLLEILQRYEVDGRTKVYVTIAGRSNALSGFVDAQVIAPVIACPPLSSTFAGADIYSSLRMPSGVAPAVVLDPAGAALLAAKMIGMLDARVANNVREFQERLVSQIQADDAEVSINDNL